MTGQRRHPFLTYLKMFPHIYIRLTLHVVMLICRNDNSSQDSTASSLTAEKMLHRQDRNPTPERLQAKANPSTNRRKRLVRQFSLWVHISFDQPSVVTNTPHNTWSYSKAMRSKWHLVRLFSFICWPVTTKMKIISQKHLQPSPPRAQESQALPAHWINRYSHPFTHRWHTLPRKHTLKHHKQLYLTAHTHSYIGLMKLLLVLSVNKHGNVLVYVCIHWCVFQGDNMPALELSSPSCPSPLPSPHLSPSYYRSSIPHLAPYLAVQSDR